MEVANVTYRRAEKNCDPKLASFSFLLYNLAPTALRSHEPQGHSVKREGHITKRNDDKKKSPAPAGQSSATYPKSVQESGATDASLSRRAFLSRATVSTAVAATAVNVPSLLSKRALASQESNSPDIARITEGAELSDAAEHHGSRRERAFRTRVRAACHPNQLPFCQLWISQLAFGFGFWLTFH